jgi:hypothetical protein
MQGLDMARGDLNAPGLNKGVVEAAMADISKRANQARGLIAAALNGARDASSRLDALIQSDGQIGAYDRNGGQVTMKRIGSPYNKTI